MQEELQDIPEVLEIKVPLKSRIFTLTGLVSLSFILLYLSTLVPKYGMLLGRDILGMKAEFLQVRLSNAFMSYPLYALAGATFLYAVYVILSIKMKSYRLNHLNLAYRHGVLTTNDDPMELTVIRDQRERRSIMQRLLGLSTVIIDSQDRSHPILEVKGIEKDDAKKLMIFINNYAFRSYTDYRIKKDLKNDLNKGKGSVRRDKDYIAGEDAADDGE